MSVDNARESAGQNVLFGIAVMVISTGLFALADAGARTLGGTYSAVQIVFVRYLIFFVACLVCFRPRGIGRLWRTRDLRGQIVRSAILVLEVGVFILAVQLLPLAEVHTISGVAPMIAVVLAGLLLKERLGGRLWAAVVAGFVGVLLVMQPTPGHWTWALLVPFAGASLWALYQVMVRVSGLRDGTDTTSWYTAVVGLALVTAVLPFGAPSSVALKDLPVLLLIGVSGSAAHFAMIYAFRLAPVSALQPFSYAIVAWAIVLGYLVFGELPGPVQFVGICVVLTSGLYAARHCVTATIKGDAP